jgi:hypothetical protein
VSANGAATVVLFTPATDIPATTIDDFLRKSLRVVLFFINISV